MAAYIDSYALYDLALRLRDARLAAGLTLDDVAEAVGCSRSLLSKIERGERTLTIQKAEALAPVLGVPRRELIDDAADIRIREPWLVTPCPRIVHWPKVADAFSGRAKATALGVLYARDDFAASFVAGIEEEARESVRLLQLVAHQHRQMDLRAYARGALDQIVSDASTAESPFSAPPPPAAPSRFAVARRETCMSSNARGTSEPTAFER